MGVFAKTRARPGFPGFAENEARARPGFSGFAGNEAQARPFFSGLALREVGPGARPALSVVTPHIQYNEDRKTLPE